MAWSFIIFNKMTSYLISISLAWSFEMTSYLISMSLACQHLGKSLIQNFDLIIQHVKQYEFCEFCEKLKTANIISFLGTFHLKDNPPRDKPGLMSGSRNNDGRGLLPHQHLLDITHTHSIQHGIMCRRPNSVSFIKLTPCTTRPM
jgi:hypothetical protein